VKSYLPGNDFEYNTVHVLKSERSIFCSEKRKKKEAVENNSEPSRPDQQYMFTFMMLSCLVLAFPFDLPDFMPSLISEFLRHSAIPVSQLMVARTIRTFLRTHEDRHGNVLYCFVVLTK
jgi:hypothetical protein